MDSTVLILASSLGLLFCGLVGSIVAGQAQERLGFLCGLLLGPIGVIVSFVFGRRAAAARARRIGWRPRNQANFPPA